MRMIASERAMIMSNSYNRAVGHMECLLSSRSKAIVPGGGLWQWLAAV
jgi:hypothetical protein